MKIKYLIFTILAFLLFSSNVLANKINSIDVSIFINEDGSANITETWDMYVDKGTEVYKPVGNFGNMELNNFRVSENGSNYVSVKQWNVNDSLSKKSYRYGINFSNEDMELCWGMGSYGNHVYTIQYKLVNFVFNTNDAQAVYYKAINNDMDPAPKNISIGITSFYKFPDTLDVWGYGYNGYAYVNNGKIELSNKNTFNSSDYAVVLIKFPKNTFKASTSYEQFPMFNNVLTTAKKGTGFLSWKLIFGFFLKAFATIAICIIPFALIFIKRKSNSDGVMSTYKINDSIATIDPNKIVPFRDIPCNGDMYRVNNIAHIYSMNIKKENIIGAILLKWILYDKVSIVKLPDTLIRKNRISIDLKDYLAYTDDTIEKSLYHMMNKASEDNILEPYEFERWSSRHYEDIDGWFTDLNLRENKKMVDEGLLYNSKEYLQTKYDINPELETYGIQVFGLKKFLEEFSNINQKQPIEVKLWKEYLIYAQIFGIADQVAKQFKNLYPEIRELVNYNIDDVLYDISMINHMARGVMDSSIRGRNAAARRYTSGGGGFSSSGGGGGSFGGGSGGGCR